MDNIRRVITLLKGHKLAAVAEKAGAFHHRQRDQLLWGDDREEIDEMTATAANGANLVPMACGHLVDQVHGL